jgi:hypothetical protein
METVVFHIVLNTNISYKSLAEIKQEDKLKLIKDIRATCQQLTDNIKEYQTGNNILNNVLDKSFNLEVGPARKFLHIDGWISFNKATRLDFKKITALFNDKIKQSKGFYLNVRMVKNQVNIIKEYSKKDGNNII